MRRKRVCREEISEYKPLKELNKRKEGLGENKCE